MQHNNIIRTLTSVLASIGALNWGLISTAEFNLVEAIFNNYPLIMKVIYAMVGLSGLYNLIFLFYPAINSSTEPK